MRLVHAADLHLDSPLRGLSRLGDDALADRLRSASRRALVNLVDLVVNERIQVLLLAGDIYDGDWHDYSTGRFFVGQLERLQEAAVRVFMVAGNHDAASEITRSLRLPPNVTALDTEHPSSEPEDDLGLVVHGQGFATRAVTRNLAVSYPPRIPGLVNVGLLHTSVDGVQGHDRYAPCRLDELTALGYDYFALGHVHQRGILAEGEHTVAYSGNLQGRHPRETGAKGALVVDVEPRSGARVEFLPLDVARWTVAEVPCDGCATLDDALTEAERRLGAEPTRAEGRLVVARVVFTGETLAASELVDTVRLREEIERIGARLGVVVERVEARVSPPAHMDVDDELRAEVLEAASALASDPRLVQGYLRDLETEVGRELREAELFDLRRTETLRDLALRAETELRARLAVGGMA